ncbi:MAG: S-methyl-5'-thioadenosine phosphorylase [Deltaproteobacteria bacterium]|nr:S-methyl-5'-thioadenosine phosphorylase [Deltaproteobacteria bacterium]
MLGIIGGTGLYKLEGLSETESVLAETPFGKPSSPILIGRMGKARLAFLARHGHQHELLPSEINYRANIWALKSVGVRRLIGVSAVGSLQPEIHPGDLVVPTQYLDFTKGRRASTFFGEGIVAHVSTANPTCPQLTGVLKTCAASADIPISLGRTYACVEGPRLGTRAESEFLRLSKADLVGMTNVPEVFLAREAQLCYCTIAVVTDYDCWQEDPLQHVSVDQVLALYKKNIGKVQHLIIMASQYDDKHPDCTCRKALANSILTSENHLSQEKRNLADFLKQS